MLFKLNSCLCIKLRFKACVLKLVGITSHVQYLIASSQFGHVQFETEKLSWLQLSASNRAIFYLNKLPLLLSWYQFLLAKVDLSYSSTFYITGRQSLRLTYISVVVILLVV